MFTATKETIIPKHKLEVLFHQMQRFEVKNAGLVWAEITNTIGNLVLNKNEFSPEDFTQEANSQFAFMKSVIFEKGKARKEYIDAHKKDWPDVETQLNYLSNDRRVKLIFFK